VLRGAPGSGKSTLLRWAAEHAGAARVVSVDVVEQDRHRPRALLGSVVSLLGDGLSLTAADPADTLRAVLSWAPAEPIATPALGAALVSLFAACARDQALVVFVDGAQWADVVSRDALVFAVRRLEHDGVLFLFAERDCEPEGFAAWLPTIEIAGLSPLDAVMLLANEVDTRVAEELCRETEGNPLRLIEIGEQLSPEQRRGETPLDPAPPLGEVLRRGFIARTDALGEDESRALLVASTDPGLDRETLIGATLSWGIHAAAVDRVEAPTLLCVADAGIVRFAHPLLRAAVYESADADDRRTAHRLVAAELCRDADADRRAWHLAAAAAGPDPAVADALAAVAQIKHNSGEAGETWQRAALLSPDPAQRYERLAAAGSAFVSAGENLRAVHAFDDAIAIVDDVDRRAEVMVRRTMPALESLGARGLRDALDELSAQLDRSDPRVHVLVALSGAVAMLQGDFVGAVSTLRSEAESPPGPTRTMLDVALLLTGEITRIDHFVAYTEQLAADRLAEFRDDEFMLFALTWAGEHSAASRMVDPLIEHRRTKGTPVALAFALSARAHLYFRTGQWEAARADANESVELASHPHRLSTLARSLYVLARIEAALGNTELAIEHARASYDIGERYEFGALSWQAGAAMGFTLLSDGRPTEAVEWLECAQGFARTHEVSLIGATMSAPDLVESYLHCGRIGAAARIVDELASGRPDQQGALGHALFLRCRALVGGSDAVDDFEAALQQHAEVQAPFEEARTRLCFGERLRRDRDVVAAHRNLTAAAEMFTVLGASAWKQRAEMEAAACRRGRSPALTTTRVDSLTPQEHRVAIEVAKGGTSREVAASLYLSTRTVEYHLGKIYRKLGLRSRTDLVRRIAADPGVIDHIDQQR
jgi:DNA-binding CsgD family transcriptional regulator